MRTHTKFGIKSYEIDILTDIRPFDPTQDHQFDPWMKILLAYCSAWHPRRFDVPHYYVWKIKITPWAPQRPEVPPLGHDPGDRMKIPSDMFCVFHCENTHKVCHKSLKLTL